MKKIVIKILVSCGLAIVWLVSLLPFVILYGISDIMYFFLYRVSGYRLSTVHNNLVSSFPEKSNREIKQIEQDFYHWFCDYIVETIKLLTISKKEMRKRMVFKGIDDIEKCIAKGTSCGVLLGHYCNWEWISTLPLAVSSEIICAEIYHPIENAHFNNLFLRIRQRFGSVCIPMEETLRHIIRYQNEGRPMVIGYIADQKPNWRNIHLWTNFLNHNTPVLTGSERIIKHTNQSFFYGDVRCLRRGYYECEFKLLERFPKKVPDYQLTLRYVKELENSICRAPAYWLWSHDRWSRTKEEFDARFYIQNGRIFEKVSEAEYAKQKGWNSYWKH